MNITISSEQLYNKLSFLWNLLREANIDASDVLIVGGASRDMLLGGHVNDIDIILNAEDLSKLKQLLRNKEDVAYFRLRGGLENYNLLLRDNPEISVDVELVGALNNFSRARQDASTSSMVKSALSKNGKKKDVLPDTKSTRNAKSHVSEYAPNNNEAPNSDITDTGNSRPFLLKWSEHAQLLLRQDLHRRDFTINAIALKMSAFSSLFKEGRIPHSEASVHETSQSFTPFHLSISSDDIVTSNVQALHDITVNPPVIRVSNPQVFADDPIRILRLVRIASKYNAVIDKTTLTLAQQSLPALQHTAPERMRNELMKILSMPTEKMVKALALMSHLKVFSYMGLPEFDAMLSCPPAGAHRHNVFLHTLGVMVNMDIALGNYSRDKMSDELSLNAQRINESVFDIADTKLWKYISRNVLSRTDTVIRPPTLLSAAKNIARDFIAYENSDSTNNTGQKADNSFLTRFQKIPEVQEYGERAALMFLTMMHDIGKPESLMFNKTGAHYYEHEVLGAKRLHHIMQELRFSSKFLKWVEKITRGHMIIHLLTSSFDNRNTDTLQNYITQLSPQLRTLLNAVHRSSETSPNSVESRRSKSHNTRTPKDVVAMLRNKLDLLLDSNHTSNTLPNVLTVSLDVFPLLNSEFSDFIFQLNGNVNLFPEAHFWHNGIESVVLQADGSHESSRISFQDAWSIETEVLDAHNPTHCVLSALDNNQAQGVGRLHSDNDSRVFIFLARSVSGKGLGNEPFVLLPLQGDSTLKEIAHLREKWKQKMVPFYNNSDKADSDPSDKRANKSMLLGQMPSKINIANFQVKPKTLLPLLKGYQDVFPWLLLLSASDDADRNTSILIFDIDSSPDNDTDNNKQKLAAVPRENRKHRKKRKSHGKPKIQQGYIPWYNNRIFSQCRNHTEKTQSGDKATSSVSDDSRTLRVAVPVDIPRSDAYLELYALWDVLTAHGTGKIAIPPEAVEIAKKHEVKNMGRFVDEWMRAYLRNQIRGNFPSFSEELAQRIKREEKEQQQQTKIPHQSNTSAP